MRDTVIPTLAERRPELSVIKPSPQAFERQRIKSDFGSALHAGWQVTHR
jgi:hypothetical protein